MGADVALLRGKVPAVAMSNEGDFSGQVKGGKVYGQWPGPNPEQLYQDRNLAITTDYRRVLAEAVWKSLGARDMNLIFPEAGVGRGSFLDYLPVG